MRVLAAIGLLLVATPAFADDCPPGSAQRSEDGYTFCEPSVCQSDDQCKPDEVCRHVALCMKVGSLDVDAALLGKAPAKRLVVTKACGPDKSCPHDTTCSDLGRCLTKATAERMAILETKTPDAKPAEAPKKACGCVVVGVPANGLAAIAVGLTILGARARRARSRRAR